MQRIHKRLGSGRLLVIGTAALFVARLAISLIRTGPVVLADEMGYLGNARILAWDKAPQLHLAPFYRGGYSLLLAPLIGLGSDQVSEYHLVLALNAALAASVFPLLYVLLTRRLEVAPRIAIWAALAGAVYPAVTVLSQAALSENALFPLVVLWLLAVGWLFDDRPGRAAPLWRGVALGVTTTALLAVHGRMVVAVGVAFLMLALALWRGVDRSAVIAAAFVIVAGIFGVHLLDVHLLESGYEEIARSEGSERISALHSGHGPLTAIANLIGQAWYLLVATAGLALVVLADAGARWRRGGWAALPASELGLALLTVGLLLISAAAFPERIRPDMLVYGRYVEIVSPALIAFGLTALIRRGSLRTLLPWLAGLGLATALIAASASDPGTPSRWNVSALPFVTGSLGPAVVVGATGVALVCAYGLSRLAHRERLLCLAAIGVLSAISLYGAWDPVHKAERGAYPPGWESPEKAFAEHRVAVVAYDLDDYEALTLYGTQWFLPNTRFVLFHGDRETPPAGFVLSDTRPRGAAPRPLWRWSGRDLALWDLDLRLRRAGSGGGAGSR